MRCDFYFCYFFLFTFSALDRHPSSNYGEYNICVLITKRFSYKNMFIEEIFLQKKKKIKESETVITYKIPPQVFYEYKGVILYIVRRTHIYTKAK